MPVLGAARPINDDALVLAGSTVGAAVVVAALTVGVAVWCVKRNKRGGKHVVHAVAHGPHGSAAGPKAVHIAVFNDDDDHDHDHDASGDSGNNAGGTAAVVLSARLQKCLQVQPRKWTSLRTMARLVRELRSLDDRLLDEPQQVTLDEATDTLHEACAEYRVLLDAAVATQDFDKAKFYQTRIAHLAVAYAHVHRDGSPHGTLSSLYECVAGGLLLKKDRFDGNSEAFLGRGASSAVSRGLLVEVVGSHETRTAVAVKEVPKTGFASEQKAVRELAIVTQKLGTHRNVVGIHTVKSTGSTFYVVIELCLFSLDEQPDAFRQLLHAPDSPEAALVLNALVQDLLRGAAFLHSKHVFHCDLKPANVLVALDRGGKKRCNFKPKYFNQAQLKLADFGVSRVVKPSKSHGFGATDSATTTTATVSLAGLLQAQGVAGTEAYMCPTLLKILRDIKAGKTEREPEIGMELLARNDAFGCGCVVAFLCSDGKHPFQHAVFKSVPDNILANRRVKLHKLGMKDARHIELVDKLTSNRSEDCWTVAETLHRSSVFEAASHGADAAEVLLDIIQLRQKPAGSCRDQLLAEPLTSWWPLLKDMVEQIDAMLEALRRNELPVELDDDSYLALAAFTFDNSVDRDANLFYLLNNALRGRKTNPEPFKRWQGFLFFLMRALDQLPPFQGTVYRGGNEGLDQETVKKEYAVGRPVQWAAFTSTTTNATAAKDFVEKDVGVIFKLTVVSGRDISAYSCFPKENEVLLSPNARFVVTSELYVNGDGYACIELTETTGHILQS